MRRLTSRAGFTLIELMVVIVVIGILATLGISSYMNMQSRSKEARVKGNCHTVQLTAEDFSIQNDGVYAADLGTTLVTGETLIGLLPGGGLLENPFTRATTEPIVGAAATIGQTGYSSVDPDGDGNPDGYAVTGYGENQLILTVTSGQ
jgi:prepilin-type N-terminal cleavage/methylation domain-containing protein